jgi:hypothetical protein
MPKKEPNTTYIFEAKFQFQGIDECLFVSMNNREWERIVNVLEGDAMDFRFYGTDPCEGYEVYINPRHVIKINLLENLPGIEFLEDEPKSEEEQERIREDREKSDAPFTFRVWSTNGSVEIYSDVSFDDCEGIRPLEDNTAAFIGFMDADGERVMLNLDHIAALEIFDTHFLSEEILSKLLNDSVDSSESEKTESNG